MSMALTPKRRTGTDFASTLWPWTRDDRVAVAEQDDEYVITFELPGFDPSEIDLRFDEGTLRVLAEHDDGVNGVMRYRQSISLHEEIEAEDLEAEYRNGVLTISFPIEELLYDRGEEIPIDH